MTAQTTWNLPFADLPQLELHTEFSSLALRPLEKGGNPRIEVHGGTPLELDVQRRGEVVVVRLAWRDVGFFPFLGFGRRVHLTAFVPEDLTGHIHTEMGRIQVEGLHVTELHVSSTAGSIELRDVKGRLHLSTQAGRVFGERLAGSIDAETQAGSVQLSIDALSPGHHRARSQVGAVHIELAPDIRAKIEAHTEMGKTRVDFPSTPDAGVLLQLSTQMGSVRVRAQGSPEQYDRHKERELERTRRHAERDAERERRHAERAARQEAKHAERDPGRGRPPSPPGFGPGGPFGPGRPPFGERPGPFARPQSPASTALVPVGPAFDPEPRPAVSAELRRVLDLVADGKLSAREAEDLLQAMDPRGPTGRETPPPGVV
jgi:hypothetical protein